MSFKGATRTGHTVCYPGKRVKVKLLDGTEFIDRFREKNNKYLIFDHHKVSRILVKSFVIYKGA